MRKKAQKKARENGAEISNQYYLFWCLCHVVTNYTLCSEESKPNQNKKEQTSPPPIPREQQEGMQEVLQSILTPRAWHGIPDLEMHSTLLPITWLHLVSMTRQGPRRQQQSYPAISVSTQLPFPSFPSPGLESLSSMKEVLFVTAGKAWHQVSWILISRPFKASLRAPTQCGGGCEGSLDGAIVKNRRKKRKPNQTTQVHLFLNKRRNWGQPGLRRVPQLGDDGRGPPWQNQVVSTGWTLPHGFSQVLVLVLTETRDSLKLVGTVPA